MGATWGWVLEAERVYTKNFLAQVIIRADFQAPLKDIRDALPAGFKKAFADTLPLSEKRDLRSQEVTLTVQQRSSEVSQRVSESFKTWRMLSADRTAVLEVNQDFVSYSVSKYLRFSEFLDPFHRALTMLSEGAPSDISYRRLGLRYIDEIRPESNKPLNWSGLIDPSLTGSLRFVERDRLLRSMGIIEVDLDHCRLRMQYGMPNPAYPGQIVEKLFVIDCDAYVEALIEPTDLDELIMELKLAAHDYFERSIGDRLRSIMEPEG